MGKKDFFLRIFFTHVSNESGSHTGKRIFKIFYFLSRVTGPSESVD
jgi:hypothetical protein